VCLTISKALLSDGTEPAIQCSALFLTVVLWYSAEKQKNQVFGAGIFILEVLGLNLDGKVDSSD
jgi:Co/Zn/Cd efflux system component